MSAGGRRPASPILIPLIALLAIAAVVAAGLMTSGSAGEREPRVPRLPAARSGYDVSDYRGLGTWIDIFDAGWNHPRATVQAIASKGVRTLYIETTNYHRRGPFVYPGKIRLFVDAADEFGVRIVAWYLPGLRNVDLDFNRSVAAIELVTKAGNSFDSFAMDIEASIVRDVDKRNARLLRLSDRVRTAAGISYPMGAIIPSPYGIEHATGYWPRFPYGQLRSYYDVYLPMTYFTWKVKGYDRTHWYTQQCIRILRRESGAPGFPIHVIGGIADEAAVRETRGFVHAVREHGLLGASYYTFPLTRSKQWRTLRAIPTNPVQSPVLPVRLGSGSGPLGNIQGGDRSHPKDVVYTTSGRRGAWELRYQAHDAQQGEITILVNWNPVGTVQTGPNGAWTGTRTRTIPNRLLRDSGRNVIAFTAAGDFPGWSDWGVRSIDLVKT